MNKNLLLPDAALLAAISISAVAQRPTAPAAQPTPAPSAAAPATAAQLPTAKMAVIYTDMFLDAKTGIAKFTTIVNKLNAEFQKLKDEITAMQTRATGLEAEINKLREAPAGTPIDQRALQAKIDQLEQLKKDIQRKGEDAQAAYTKRQGILFAPLQEDIGRALDAFAKAHNINLVIDAARVPIIYAADSMDITQAFINEFNSKNPVTAATTPPQ